MKGKSCLANPVYNEVTHLVDEERKVDVVSLDFGKAFDTVFCNTPVDKLTRYRLDKWTGR